ncbi:right-handed parallel beta-helix repeat-containing protein [Acidisoma cellulosilytica]|uniref:Right-handed parallel beta-helix repeat-containing protein n=1 Tax=Acidisoma cellulosilyticum TaxID=2802395 RepID=A0A964E3I0_9PROT|nr:right-handed parallel beta-helix repeat-containing protein [Acidisoma cellulosilyticum]MCB8880424.1 right-handed parallel beta-helix repeat-containing protein [Acidisoma cellulosilyticum]
MPTIDQLQAAVASSDTDELMTTQSGDARKVTRAQLLAGLQPAISVPPGAVLGNSGATASSPLAISIGSNLTLASGTLSAPAPFVIPNLPTGKAPAATDLVAISQSGTTSAIGYSTFLSSLATLPGFDASPLSTTAIGGRTARSLGAHAADAIALEDFGAAGDGATDDSAALTAAVATMRPVRLGPKTYIINGSMALSNAAALTLLGVPGQTVIRRLTQGSSTAWITLTAPAVHIEGVIFDANASLTASVSAVAVPASCLRSTFLRCAFSNAVAGAGLLFSQSDPTFARHTVTACEAFGNINGISAQAVDGLTVTACHLHNNSVAGIAIDLVNSAHTLKSRLANIVGNQCYSNQIGILVGDYANAYASPASIANTTSDALLCVVSANVTHDNTEYGIVAQGYNLSIQGNIVYKNGGANVNGGGILANCWVSAITGNVVSNHSGFGIDAGAANFTLIADNIVSTSRVAINAGGAQEPRVTGNFIAAASYYGIIIYNNETTAAGAPIGVASVGVSITENLIDMPAGGGGILLIDGPQNVHVARNNFITTSGADLSLCLLPLTDTVTIADNLLNGSPSVYLYDPSVTASGRYAGLNSMLYPDIIDGVGILNVSQAVQSLRSLNAGNYGSYVTFMKLTAGGSGYTTAPTVTFSGDGGSGATATAFVMNGAVIGFRMNTLGSGYTSAPTVTLSGGGGTGATATAVIGIPVSTGRRIKVYCGAATAWAVSGTNPPMTTGTGIAITTPANSEIEWVGLNGGWFAARYQQIDYVLPATDGSVTLRSQTGDMRLHPSGAGLVRWVNDAQSVGCTTSIGSGTPNGVVTAPPGSDYRNLAGGAGSTFWVKQSGTSNTGWVAIA